MVENVPKMNVIVIPQDKHLSYLYRSTNEMYYRVVAGLKDEGIFINNLRKSIKSLSMFIKKEV